VHKARGLDRKKANLERKGTERATIAQSGSTPQYNALKTSEVSKHSTEASGATPGGCARTHPPERLRCYDSSSSLTKPLQEWPHSPKGSGATVGYLNKGYPQSTIKKDKPLRKPRQRLRPRRRNEPKQRTERLDHVPTRTRLARRDASTTEKSLTRMTLGRAGRPTSLTNSETKVKAFNATANHFLLPWLQRKPAWKQYQCQISLFTAHPEMGGENLSLYTPCRALFRH
jgi:hypothetical protein